MEIIPIKTKPLPINQLLHMESASTQPIDFNSKLKILLELYKEHVKKHVNQLVVFPFAELDKEVSWTLDKTNGSFTKRLGKWWYEQFGKAMDSLTLARIGAHAAIADENKEFFFDITDKIDWERGEFGDSGSCMWSIHKVGLDHMSAAKEFNAIRFFKPKNDSKGRYADPTKNLSFSGTSRAWLWTHTMRYQQTALRTLEAPIYVVFNAYGFNSELIAKILANYLGYVQKPINIANKRDRGSHIYINGDGRLVAPKAFIDQITFINFNQPV